MLISFKDIKKQFETDSVVTKVLHGISLDIEAGDFVAIMGPSGCGKSTMMNLLGFLDTPTSGQYLFKGQDTSEFDGSKLASLRNEEVGFVFQQFNLLPRTTVFENVALPLTYSPTKIKNKKELVDRAIESVSIQHRSKNISNQLSGGEKQRVAIARALVNNPSIILADEPTGNLDSKAGEQVMKILYELNEQGKTIILVTHEKYTAEYAKRIIRLKDGILVSDEKVADRKKDGLYK
jgi:putative ABC transport system ATP-binding protein